jgi:hypothetical protein
MIAISRGGRSVSKVPRLELGARTLASRIRPSATAPPAVALGQIVQLLILITWKILVCKYKNNNPYSQKKILICTTKYN